MKTVIRNSDQKELKAAKYTGDIDAFDVPFNKVKTEEGAAKFYHQTNVDHPDESNAVHVPAGVTLVYDENPGPRDPFFHLMDDGYYAEHYTEKEAREKEPATN